MSIAYLLLLFHITKPLLFGFKDNSLNLSTFTHFTDPFELDHNLGAGVSGKMANDILTIFIRERERFEFPREDIRPELTPQYIFDVYSRAITDWHETPTDGTAAVPVHNSSSIFFLRPPARANPTENMKPPPWFYTPGGTSREGSPQPRGGSISQVLSVNLSSASVFQGHRIITMILPRHRPDTFSPQVSQFVVFPGHDMWLMQHGGVTPSPHSSWIRQPVPYPLPLDSVNLSSASVFQGHRIITVILPWYRPDTFSPQVSQFVVFPGHEVWLMQHGGVTPSPHSSWIRQPVPYPLPLDSVNLSSASVFQGHRIITVILPWYRPDTFSPQVSQFVVYPGHGVWLMQHGGVTPSPHSSWIRQPVPYPPPLDTQQVQPNQQWSGPLGEEGPRHKTTRHGGRRRKSKRHSHN